MKLFSLLIFSILSLNFIIGCESSTERKPVTTQQPPPVNSQKPASEQNQIPIEKQEKIDPVLAKNIIDVIKENMEATEKKDKKRVLNTIHKDSPQRASTIRELDYLFPQYNFHFKLNDIKVIQAASDSAVVWYSETIDQDGSRSDIVQNTFQGLHFMLKEGKEWKIFKTQVLNNAGKNQ